MMSEKEVVRAWQENEFKTYIQPIVNSRDWKVYGGELLMRRHTANARLILPCDFIDSLESACLLPAITRKMMSYAANNCK
ncbi:TPA: EAL domain-containing protein [Escherichia coli]|uniref:EAL domain-containing protein n=2 Tax=Escherichia coli TaxID=562 RepID=UPI003890A355|nr:EAL domain-containing protein [Escherichia coli]HCB2839941.1 EAL domain-containing protein [Escherichia coli]